MLNFSDITAAHTRIAPHVLDTPCVPSRTLSEICGCDVFLKFENLQFTASFKERGALNKLMQLSEQERAKGVLAVSAGNHAQGVAYHAQRLNIPAVIVMPKHTPAVKVERTRAFGAQVVLHGATFDDARLHGLELIAAHGYTLVHPYDDAQIAAGQGTIAVEMLRAHPQMDTLVIAMGGGGMISGMTVAAKAMKPGIRVVGVQTERFPALYNAKHGTALESGSATIAEGIAVKSPGAANAQLIKQQVDDCVLVAESDIERAILMLLEIEKTVVEGAGAAGLAALLAHKDKFKGRCVGLVLCGGNIDPLVLAGIIERGMVRSGRLARITVSVRDVPGALAHITRVLAEQSANIEEVHHQRAFTTLSAQYTEVDVVVQTRNAAHVDQIIAALKSEGFDAKLHH
ncbi:MAG: threonine ammonia-lyase [Burkholderiaceae bacterium]